MTRLSISITLAVHFARLARERTTKRGTSRRRHS